MDKDKEKEQNRNSRRLIGLLIFGLIIALVIISIVRSANSKDFKYIGIDNGVLNTSVTVKIENDEPDIKNYYCKDFSLSVDGISHTAKGFLVSSGKNYRLNLDGFEMLNGEVVVSISFDAVDINNAKNIKLKYEGKTVANIKGGKWAIFDC